MTEVTDPKLVEVVARQMQTVAEVNGDGLPGIIMGDGDCQWHKYEPMARAAIAAVLDFIDMPQVNDVAYLMTRGCDTFDGWVRELESYMYCTPEQAAALRRLAQSRKEAQGD